MKTTGFTDIVPEITGKHFKVVKAWMVWNTLTAASGDPSIVIRSLKDAGTNNDHVTATPSRAVGTGKIIDFPIAAGTTWADLDPATGDSKGVYLWVFAGATGTTVTADVYVQGQVV
jgi:hypothetical protein